jgi:hypothetical protein
MSCENSFGQFNLTYFVGQKRDGGHWPMAAATGAVEDHLAGGYCGRGVYHWLGYGGCVWRLEESISLRELTREDKNSQCY